MENPSKPLFFQVRVGYTTDAERNDTLEDHLSEMLIDMLSDLRLAIRDVRAGRANITFEILGPAEHVAFFNAVRERVLNSVRNGA